MIDQDMRSKYLSTSKNKYVYQRVGVEASFENNENYAVSPKIGSLYFPNRSSPGRYYVWICWFN